MRIMPTIVDDDHGGESYEVEDYEERDDPSVLSLLSPLRRIQGFEERNPPNLFFSQFICGGPGLQKNLRKKAKKNEGGLHKKMKWAKI